MFLQALKLKKSKYFLRKPDSSYEQLVIGRKLFAFAITIVNNAKLLHTGWSAFLLRQCRLGSSNFYI